MAAFRFRAGSPSFFSVSFSWKHAHEVLTSADTTDFYISNLELRSPSDRRSNSPEAPFFLFQIELRGLLLFADTIPQSRQFRLLLFL